MATNSFRVSLVLGSPLALFSRRSLDKLNRLVAFALQGSSSIAATSDNAGYITASL